MRKSTRLSSSQRTLPCRLYPENPGKTETTPLRSPKTSQMIYYGARSKRTRLGRTSNSFLLLTSLLNIPSSKTRSCLHSVDRVFHTRSRRERNIYILGISRFLEIGKRQTVQFGFWTGLLSSNTLRILGCI